MRRRQVLAGATALLALPLAGCADPSNVLDMQEATPEALADEVAIAVAPESEEYAVVEEAVENGSATVSGRSAPLDTDDPVRFQGSYYELSVTEVGSRERTSYEIRVDYDPETTTANDSIAYTDLPAVDRNALDGVVPPRGDPPAGEGFEIGTQYAYPENGTNRSVLVPTQRYDRIRYGNSTYRVEVEAVTVTETDYRYEVTEVASSTDAFAAQLRSTYQFALSRLTSAEREVVEEAIDSGYFEDATDAFRSVVARLLAHRGLDTSDAYGTWLVEYESTPYIAYAEFPPDVTAVEQ